MDVTDKKILGLVQNKADLQLSEIARHVGISKTACWNRVRRLEEIGVIEGRFTKLNRFALDYAGRLVWGRVIKGGILRKNVLSAANLKFPGLLRPTSNLLKRGLL